MDSDKRELERRLAGNGMKLVCVTRGPWRYAIEDTAGRIITKPLTLADVERFVALFLYQESGEGKPYDEVDPKRDATTPAPQQTEPEGRRARIVLDSDEVV